VGLTGWVCGAHLHMQVQSTCDSWYCQSFPAEFVDYGDPDEDVPMPSNNCPVVEPCTVALDGTSTTIDDADPRCFRKVSSWWWPGDGGWEDAHQWTWTNDDAEPDTIGRWEFGVQVPGRYRVSAFIPDAQAKSQMATYEIQTGAEMVAVGPIDQSTNKGWIDLGVHEFVAGEEHWVRLRDNTGEHRDLDREISFDAIRLEWAPAGADSGETGEEGGSHGGTSGDDGGDDAGTGTPSDDDGVPPGTDGESDGGPSLPPPSADDDAGGCHVGGPHRSAGAFLALVVLAVRRRLRRSIAARTVRRRSRRAPRAQADGNNVEAVVA
jgi:hypothetical protein